MYNRGVEYSCKPMRNNGSIPLVKGKDMLGNISRALELIKRSLDIINDKKKRLTNPTSVLLGIPVSSHNKT